MQTTSQRSIISVLSIILIFGCLILFNAVSRSAFRNASVDLTADGEYTLSQGTLNILDGLEHPIQLKFFYSSSANARYPIVRLWGERIRDLLREYERRSNGLITLEILDPRPDSEVEEWAQRYGLVGIPTRENEPVYVGLVGLSASGEEQAIPVFDLQRQQYLEYDVSRMVSALSKESRVVIGLMSPLPVFGATESATRPALDPWIVLTQLKELAEVRSISPTAEVIPEDVELLVVVHPREFALNQWYAIDQFVMRGGRLILFADPWSSVDIPANAAENQMASLTAVRSSSPNPLTKAWGVTLREGSAVADLQYSLVVPGRQGEPQQNHLLLVNLDRRALSQEDPITSQLDSVLLPWVGSFDIEKKEGIKVEVLAHSSPRSMLAKESDYRFGGGDPEGLMRRFLPGEGSYPLVVRLSGKLPSAFSGGRPPEAESKEPHLSETKGQANVLLFADVDFMYDHYSVSVNDVFGAKLATPINDNLNLVLNAVENLSGSDDLISVRSRGQFTRPFTRIQQLESEAQRKWREEEMVLQSKLAGANQRLQQLQAGVGKVDGARQLYDSALLQEIEKFREEKLVTQRNLRKVRRNLRQGIERLGQALFALNTFTVPALLILGYIVYHRRQRRIS